MRSNRSSRQCGCCRCCGNNRSDSAFSTYRVTYQRRFMTVPMRVFNGAGYSSRDALESIAGSLQTISQRSCEHCGSCNDCNGCG